jgi:cytochrome b
MSLRRRRQQSFNLPMRVWDLPTRLYHWLLVLLLPASYITAKAHRLDTHMTLGLIVMALLLFRLAWGFIGSDTARFSRFLTSPVAGLRHLARPGQREPNTEIGHNAAGGWMVLLLLLLAVQVGTGLFAHDGRGLVAGPLARDVSGTVSDELSLVHAITVKVIIAVVVLHLLAIAAHSWLKGQNLIRPMITGKKRLPATTRAPRMASPALAAAVLALAAAITWAIATRL